MDSSYTVERGCIVTIDTRYFSTIISETEFSEPVEGLGQGVKDLFPPIPATAHKIGRSLCYNYLMIKLVVLDFDDTLSLTEEACFYIENEAAQQLGFSPMTREAHLKNWGKPLAEAIVERIPGIDVKAFLIRVEQVRQRYVTEGKADSISKNNQKFLDDLLASGRMLAVLTSRTLEEIKHLLEKDHPLNSRIEKFYHKNSSEYIKPDPRVFDQILKDFSVLNNETIYIGDSFDDAKSAKSAGIHFIAVLESGLRTKESFKGFSVDFFAARLPDAMTYIMSV